MTAARGSVRYQVRLACPPDLAWDLVGTPERVHEWLPGIVSCTVDGDERVIMTASGIPMPEQLLTVDPLLRRFQYRVTSPLFAEHLGTIDVIDLNDGTSLVTYATDARPAVLALVIGAAARAGLFQLADLLGVDQIDAPVTTLAPAPVPATVRPRREATAGTAGTAGTTAASSKEAH